MYKYVKSIILILAIFLSFHQLAFASEKPMKPPKPTEGIESIDPKYGSSKDINIIFSLDASSLLSDWNCSITNTGTKLSLNGESTAYNIADQLTLTLYLQIWDGSNWIDINSWTWNSYSSSFISKATTSSYQSNNYYRVRGVHYAKKGSQEQTQNSTSSYIYIP
ncbi:hypothetical protein OXPF_00160 [Oxobacter pfennigii]|uniref:Uncharacterized protein n=1 Tax=Oxobacter pfennigii TaxID=36849 RepID=A0A0P8WC86_9CLOT|nr:hypothetical protein [Oxobacter pfennigii]KPU46374.1 hypothetical protein OXPF_00160 [Oxobacter pfennigii]